MKVKVIQRKFSIIFASLIRVISRINFSLILFFRQSSKIAADDDEGNFYSSRDGFSEVQR